MLRDTFRVLSVGWTLRPLTAADVEPVRWVIYQAYAQVLLDLYGSDAAAQYEVRDPAFMRLYLDREPEGNFVAEAADGTPVGVVFCFVWGEVGWFGSLAVAPEWQGRGLGQALTHRAVDYLRARGCRRIGLETWPDSALVRHLYGKLGFTPGRSTIKLARPAVASPVPPAWQFAWIDHEDPAALAAVDEVTQRLMTAGEPRVDYRREVAIAVRHGVAQLLLVRHRGQCLPRAQRGGDGASLEQAVALAILRRPSGRPVAALDVRLLLVPPGTSELPMLDALLGECQRRAIATGVGNVSCDVNLRHTRAASLLRERGFHPTYELLRMEQPTEGFDQMSRASTIECVRWAG